jgi:hypothetical protein
MTQGKALFPVLIALSLGHLINDTIQSLLPAIYPIIKQVYQLDFGQIGLLTLTFQLAACIFQPLVGHINDQKPMPYSIVAGMAFSLAGLLTLAYALSFETLLVGATLVGLGSSIFHPEATRMARQASGGEARRPETSAAEAAAASTAEGPRPQADRGRPACSRGLRHLGPQDTEARGCSGAQSASACGQGRHCSCACRARASSGPAAR